MFARRLPELSRFVVGLRYHHMIKPIQYRPRPRPKLAIGGQHNECAELGLSHVMSRTLCTKDIEKAKEESEIINNEQQNQSSFENFNLRSKRPSKFERRILVLVGRYKSDKEIPMFVSNAIINNTKNKFRIAVNICMGVCTIFGSIVMIYIGRKRMKAGESIVGINRERRKDYYNKIQKSE